MNATSALRRPIAATLLAIFAVTTFAPAAFAGHGPYKVRRYRGPVPVTRVVHTGYYAPGTTVVVHDNVAPVLAGIFGGIILGTAIANASAPHPVYAAEYAYYDPYCRVSYASLDQCRAHFAHHPGPRIVRVIDVSSGQCVHAYQWCDGWRDWDDGSWDD